MRFLKTIIVAGLIGLPVMASAEPKTHFNLHSQLYSETKNTDEMTGARYNLPDSFVNTNLIYEDGVYTTLNDRGFFKAELKDPARDWSVSIDAFYGVSSYLFKNRSIKISAENGESIIISIKRGNVTFNGENVYDAPTGARLTFGVKNSDSKVELTVNGSKVATVEYPDFNKLKFVEVQLISEEMAYLGSWDNGIYYDVLHDLTIGER